MFDDPAVREPDDVDDRDVEGASRGRAAHHLTRVDTGRPVADPDRVVGRDEVEDLQLEIAEPRVKRPNGALRAIDPRPIPALVLDRVGCHELVADGQVAAGESLIDEPACRCDVLFDRHLVLLRGFASAR